MSCCHLDFMPRHHATVQHDDHCTPSFPININANGQKHECLIGAINTFTPHFVFLYAYSYHHFFTIICIVDFCIILVRNGMPYAKKKSPNLVTVCLMQLMPCISSCAKKKRLINYLLFFQYVFQSITFMFIAGGSKLDNHITKIELVVHTTFTRMCSLWRENNH